MSATTKSNSLIAPVANKSRDWTKASILELQSGSKDKSNILDAKGALLSQASEEGGEAMQGRGGESST